MTPTLTSTETQIDRTDYGYPLSEYHRELRLKALYLANQDRIERGLEPIDELPRGRRNMVNHCVLARAAGRKVLYMGRVRSLFGQTGVSFVNAFDRNVYPDLVE